MKLGIYPGSYNPFSLGHLDIAIRALDIVDRLIISVGVNASKAISGLDIQTRMNLIELTFADMAPTLLDRIHISSYTGLLTEYVKSVTPVDQKSLIIRGLRAVQDFNYEFELHGILKQLQPNIEISYLMAPSQFMFVSSSAIRELAQNHIFDEKYCSPSVNLFLKDFYK